MPSATFSGASLTSTTHSMISMVYPSSLIFFYSLRKYSTNPSQPIKVLKLVSLGHTSPQLTASSGRTVVVDDLFKVGRVFMATKTHYRVALLQQYLMKNILCIGGSGQLGQHVVSALSKYHVFNVDFKPHQSAHHNIILQKQSTPAQNNSAVIESVKKLQVKFNAILVTAGGWTGGNIKDEDYFEKVRIMNEVNLNPTLLAAHLSTKYLSPGGLVMFTGAASVYKQPQPDMIGYALAKTGVHYVATALAQRAKEFDARVLTILPQTIDTPDNRAGMPNANFNTWSKPSQISELILSWIQNLNVPSNGSFVKLSVKNGNLQPELL